MLLKLNLFPYLRFSICADGICLQWSFGVTVWEIFTCGNAPYRGIPVIYLLDVIKGGKRLGKPENEACQDEV